MKIPLSLLRKGSRSTRLWESPRVPSERYELRPCLCVFVACFDRRFFFTIRQKRIRGGRTYADCNSGSLKERRVCIYEFPYCASATRRLALDNRTYSAQLANATHKVYVELGAAGRHGRSDKGRRMGGREQGEGGGGREQGNGARKQ